MVLNHPDKGQWLLFCKPTSQTVKYIFFIKFIFLTNLSSVFCPFVFIQQQVNYITNPDIYVV